MKKFIAFLGLFSMFGVCFALPTLNGQQTEFGKNSQKLATLGNALKNQQAIHPQNISNDLAMVYGGQDVSHKPTLTAHSLA